MWDTWISWQKGGTLYYFRLRTKQSYFPHNMNKFLKKKFRASLSLISIKNWQELFLTIKRECTCICMYECMCIENSWHPASKEHFSLLLFSIFIRSQWRKNKRTRIWVLGIWNKGSCKRCVRSSDEKSLWINAKIYHTSDLSQFVKTLARAGQAWPAAS